MALPLSLSRLTPLSPGWLYWSLGDFTSAFKLDNFSSMHPDIKAFNKAQDKADQDICEVLSAIIDRNLPEAQSKIWHRHPVWFLDGNPTVGYSRMKAGIRLLFWSGADFEEKELKPGTGKFKDASMIYTSAAEVREKDLKRWLKKSRNIQWDYKNIYIRKGKLKRLK